MLIRVPLEPPLEVATLLGGGSMSVHQFRSKPRPLPQSYLAERYRTALDILERIALPHIKGAPSPRRYARAALSFLRTN